jgi:hypothetical protein
MHAAIMDFFSVRKYETNMATVNGEEEDTCVWYYSNNYFYFFYNFESFKYTSIKNKINIILINF